MMSPPSYKVLPKLFYSGLLQDSMGVFGADPVTAAEPEAIGGAERVFDFSVCNRTRAETSVAISAR